MDDRSPLRLSVLDQSPILPGYTAVEAVQQTVALAQLAESVGYYRYWLAEHHNSSTLAGSSPEIMVARIAAATSGIRVGSGGVMLQHYSPLKVAENFRLLEALFPGRVDLGIGRAPGSNAATALALHGGPPSAERFAVLLRDLMGYLHDGLPADHPSYTVRATPMVQTVPELWMLGSTDGGAAYAAYFGMAFSFAHFINSSGMGTRVMAQYREQFQARLLLRVPRGSVAVRVVCADTEEQALDLARTAALVRLRMRGSEPLRQGMAGVDEILAAPVAESERAAVQESLSSAVIGAVEQVRTGVLQVAADYAVDEIVVLTICHDPAARARSYKLLAEAMGMSAVPTRPPVGATLTSG
jgi:luciferase family oxidoreductase group 1